MKILIQIRGPEPRTRDHQITPPDAAAQRCRSRRRRLATPRRTAGRRAPATRATRDPAAGAALATATDAAERGPLCCLARPHRSSGRGLDRLDQPATAIVDELADEDIAVEARLARRDRFRLPLAGIAGFLAQTAENMH